jgi:hypothetical protein
MYILLISKFYINKFKITPFTQGQLLSKQNWPVYDASGKISVPEPRTEVLP